jgi:hypothetical protein
LPKAHAWLNNYNREEIIELRDAVNAEYAATMDDKRCGQVEKLRVFLQGDIASITVLEETVYAIPKDPALNEKETKNGAARIFQGRI